MATCLTEPLVSLNSWSTSLYAQLSMADNDISKNQPVTLNPDQSPVWWRSVQGIVTQIFTVLPQQECNIIGSSDRSQSFPSKSPFKPFFKNTQAKISLTNFDN